MFAWHFFCVALFAAVSDSAVGTPTLDSLVELQMAGAAMVHSIDMAIVNRRLSRNGKSDLKVVALWRWSVDGKRERQRFNWITMPLMANDRAVNQKFGDLFQDGREMRILKNWNPDDPPKLHPRDQGPVRAWFGEETRTPPGGGFPNPMAQFAMFDIEMDLEDDSRTLAELVRESPKAILRGAQNVRGHKTWFIQIDHPQNVRTEGDFSGSVYDIYLDPTENYLVRKMVCHRSSRGEHQNDLEREVLRFGHYPNGVVIPLEVETRLYTGVIEGPVSVHRYTADKVFVNEPLPSDALNFRFPENTVVVKVPPEHGKYVIHLAAADGALGRLSSTDELGPFPSHRSASSPAAARNTFFSVAATAAFILLLSGILVGRLMSKRRKVTS